MKKIGVACLVCASALFGSGVFLSGCGGTSDITSITVTTLPTTEYVVGNYIDLTGGKFTAVCDNGKTLELELSLASVDTSRLDTVGEHVVNVVYANKKSSFKVMVKKAKYDISIPDIFVTYNGQQQGLSREKLLQQTVLGEGMSVESILYRQKNTGEFVETLPQNAGIYEIKIGINGGEYYEDTSIIANFTIQKADFAGFKEQNPFRFANNVLAAYQTDWDISNLWVQSIEEKLNVIYDLNSMGLNIPLGPITLHQADLPSQDSMAVTYEIFDSNQHLLENITNIKDLSVGNYTIVTTCTTNTGNFKEYNEITNLSVRKKSLILGNDFNVKISYNDVNNSPQNRYLVKTDSPSEYSGQFTDVKNNFQVIIEPDSSSTFNVNDFIFEMEYGNIPQGNMAPNRYKIVQSVNETGEYCLRIRYTSENFEYTGLLIFTVEFENS